MNSYGVDITSNNTALVVANKGVTCYPASGAPISNLDTVGVNINGNAYFTDSTFATINASTNYHYQNHPNGFAWCQRTTPWSPALADLQMTRNTVNGVDIGSPAGVFSERNVRHHCVKWASQSQWAEREHVCQGIVA